MGGTDIVASEHRVYFEGMETELGEVIKSGKFWYVSISAGNRTEPGGADSDYMGGFPYWKAAAHSAVIFSNGLKAASE